MSGEFSLRLQHGIQGGFAPPTPNAIHTVTHANDQLHIMSALREDGTSNLNELAPKCIDPKNDDTSALVAELKSILKDLPTEQPPGSEDIYGLDTSIAFGSDDLQWMNGAPEGCGGGESFVKASDEEKRKFKRAVDIVNILVQKTE